ncbi:MAG: EamA family transporter [Rhodobacteraceae bacterium]|nr:EamA family transporter [Paracoccaceae bacterium]
MTSLTLGLIAALCWGLHDITIRYLSRSAPMMASLLFVLIIGSVFQAGAFLFFETGAVSREALVMSALAGVAFLLANVGLYFSFARGPVRFVTPIIACFSVISVGIALFEGATLSLGQAAAIAALMTGILIVGIATPEDDAVFPPLLPTIGFALLAAFGFAATFRLGQMAAEMSGDIEATLISRITAFVLLGAVLVARAQPIWPGRAALIPLVGMGILDSIAIFSVVSAAPLPKPEYASVATSTFGLLTIVLAWGLLKEAMSRAQWVGCLITFSAVGYLAL